MSDSDDWSDADAESPPPQKRETTLSSDEEEEEDWVNFKVAPQPSKKDKLEKLTDENAKLKEEVAKLKEKIAQLNQGLVDEQHTVKTTGMYRKYNDTKSDLDTASDLLSGIGQEKVHIELLEPVSRKDWDEYSQMVGEMVVNFYSNKHYKKSIQDILSLFTKYYTIGDLKQLQKYIDSLIVLKRNSKKSQQENTQKKEETLAVPTSADAFEGLEEVNPDDQEEEFDDDDFM